MQKSDAINELAAALAKAQGKIKGAIKDSTNTFFKTKFADLDACWEVARGPLSENGLAVVQPASSENGVVKVQTLLLHSSGQWLDGGALSLTLAQPDPQKEGIIISYFRRYGFCAMVGITQQDDDAESAMHRQPESRQAQHINKAVAAVERRLDGQGRPIQPAPKRGPEAPFP